MKKRIAFVPADANHLKEFETLVKSIRKFHSEEELPLIKVDNPNPADQAFWYRAKPIIASDLLKEYETVIGLDSDQIIVGPLDKIWEGDFDAGVVFNDPSFRIQLWDIQPYFNNGLVVLKNLEFVEKWQRLCFSPHFNSYQFKEQDLLNILCSDYFDYKVKPLDGERIYGEGAKPFWPQFNLVDNKIMIGNQQLCVIHFGGGAQSPDKGNYRIRFKPEVVSFIDKLIK